MTEPAQPLTGGQILGLLREVADRLPPTVPRPVLILVGGALLATAGLRDTTQDADSVRRLTPQVQAAAVDVALVHQNASWLNAAAAPTPR